MSKDCKGMQKVLMDAIWIRTGVYCVQWKDDKFVVRMPRRSDPPGTDARGRRLLKLSTKVARERF